MDKIGQEKLSLDGWEKVVYNHGMLIQYSKTYKPHWASELMRYNCSVRVRFPDDYRNEEGFMVWISTANAMVPVPGCRTMTNLKHLLNMLIDNFED